MKRLKIQPTSLTGTITIPPSKSQTLRAIFFASLAEGESYITHILRSPDTTAMINACRAFGAKITESDDTLAVQGVAGFPLFRPATTIDAGNSGIVLRFVTAIAALTSQSVTLTGDDSIQSKRPIKPLLQALTQLGAHCGTPIHKDFAPVIIQGPIHSGSVTLDGQDSQPVSALLYAGIFLAGTTRINVINPGETPWIQLSLAWLERFGIRYKRAGFQQYELTGVNKLFAFNYRVPGDFSTLLFPLAAGIVTGSEVTINGLLFQDPQGDKVTIELLSSMGAKFDIDKRRKSITVKNHRGINGIQADLNACVDALPIMAVLACFANSESHFMNVAVARNKESDRIDAICNELTKMGAAIQTTPDGLKVKPARLSGAEVCSHNDHRIAMALAIAALGADGETIIDDCHCIQKSYGDFYNDFKQLGADIEMVL